MKRAWGLAGIVFLLAMVGAAELLFATLLVVLGAGVPG